MPKVNNLFLLFLFLCSFFAKPECHEGDSKANFEINQGELSVTDSIDLSFERAVSTDDLLELEKVKVTSCKNSSVWDLTAEQAELNGESLTIKNTKLRIFGLPIFWLGEVSINEEDNFNIPNLGVTDSNLDISYKFKTKTENSVFTIEPIYTNSSFGLSMDFGFDDGLNNFNFKSLALDDENSSWVYDIDSIINLNESVSLTLDYSDLSGNSLIQNYGYKYLDINRRSLDLKQSIGISVLKDNRNLSIFADNFVNIGALRPVSHSKDYILYERYFVFGNWGIDVNTEFAKFENISPFELMMPYEVVQEAERVSRDIYVNRNIKFNSATYSSQYLISHREYEFIKKEDIVLDQNRERTSTNFSTRQMFSLLQDNSLKIGVIWSTFEDEKDLPILDSYPLNPSPESNMSLMPWVGKDRTANSRKLFISKNWMTDGMNFSISTNLYEKYNFANESMIFKKFYDKDPIFFSLTTKNSNFNFFAKGNYSYEKSDFLALMAGVSFKNDSTFFSFQKNNLIPSSYPLKPIDNYMLKFKKDFQKFKVFSRVQYSRDKDTVNENILGIEWEYDCLRLRLSAERARFFPFIDPNYTETTYFDLVNLTNPKVKNNLSFEFELVGLTNILTPIDNIINNGLFN
tara:strand:- start:7021 stop:8913 length:1893 start_codon:yes stop_codon:yes gene_type:complete